MFSWGELFSTFLVRKIMGAKGSFRSPNGGGSFCMLPTYQTSLPFLSLSCSHRVKLSGNRGKSGKNRAKVKIYLLALVFSRNFRRQQRAKIKHILESGHNEGAKCGLFACLLACPLGQVVGSCGRFSGLSPPFVACSLALVVCSLPFGCSIALRLVRSL